MDHYWQSRTCCGHDACDEAVREMERRLHAAEVERDCALTQLHEQNEKLDRAQLAVDALREDL